MQAITTVGLDIAKSIFQVHGVDADGNCCSPSAQAALCSDVVSEGAAVLGWHRGLCVIALLVAGTSSARSHRTPDAAGLRQALRQTT